MGWCTQLVSQRFQMQKLPKGYEQPWVEDPVSYPSIQVILKRVLVFLLTPGALAHDGRHSTTALHCTAQTTNSLHLVEERPKD